MYYGSFQDAIRRVGRALDARRRVSGEPDLSFRGDGDVSWIHTRQGVRPSLLMDLRGIVTIFKPTDWEVDGLEVESDDHPPLSAFLQAVFLRELFPLVHDAEHNYGFLHRLDIPSSGLVLAGTSFEGYYHLRLQLDTHRLRREYVVVCSGHAAADLTEVIARVDVAPDPSQRRSISDSGKPSQTQVTVVLHTLGQAGALEEGAQCTVAIRIATGRRHQIRAHMRFCGHPSVADARYTARIVHIAGSSTTLEIGALRQANGNIVAASLLLNAIPGRKGLDQQAPGSRHVMYH